LDLKSVRESGAGKFVKAAMAIALLSLSGCATVEKPDPLERVNRKIFVFNETLDQYALEPVARVWDFVLPGRVQTGIDNFFNNLNQPIVFANSLLQGKPVHALEDLTRLLANSIFGLAGFIDVASMAGVPDNDEDFGQTLGVWGFPAGPYLMVPLLGPYTLRSGVGDIVDSTASAYAYFNLFWFDAVGLNGFETTGASIGMRGLDLLNLRAIYLEELAESKKDAFDYYVFVRNAYLQSRRAQVLDQKDAPVVDDEDLYFYDDEDDEEYEDEVEDEEDYDDL
jgi:phospholipid-binding lipoprotein MlaA